VYPAIELVAPTSRRVPIRVAPLGRPVNPAELGGRQGAGHGLIVEPRRGDGVPRLGRPPPSEVTGRHRMTGFFKQTLR
jgi:hypothetical protein